MCVSTATHNKSELSFYEWFASWNYIFGKITPPPQKKKKKKTLQINLTEKTRKLAIVKSSKQCQFLLMAKRKMHLMSLCETERHSTYAD